VLFSVACSHRPLAPRFPLGTAAHLMSQPSRLLVEYDARVVASLSFEHKKASNKIPRYNPRVLVFDRHRGLLYLANQSNYGVDVFSPVNSSVTALFGGIYRKYDESRFFYPWSLDLDYDHDRIVAVDMGYIHVWSLRDHSLLSYQALGDIGVSYPRGIAIDKHHRRIIITESDNHRLVFLSSIDLSFLFSVGKQGSQPGEFYCPTGVTIDDDRHRIIVTDSDNHRVQVLSSIDGSFLFEFGSKGDQPCQFESPEGVCIDNQGRIIVADTNNNRLQSFTHEGHHISSFDCGIEKPRAVAFDEHRGLIAFSADHRVHVIGANQWLADTFTWHVERHHLAPSDIQRIVATMTMIRSVVDASPLSLLPNELLFEIFALL